MLHLVALLLTRFQVLNLAGHGSHQFLEIENFGRFTAQVDVLTGRLTMALRAISNRHSRASLLAQCCDLVL
jgi:hypothetical protein